jgi:hypothetical protein
MTGCRDLEPELRQRRDAADVVDRAGHDDDERAGEAASRRADARSRAGRGGTPNGAVTTTRRAAHEERDTAESRHGARVDAARTGLVDCAETEASARTSGVTTSASDRRGQREDDVRHGVGSMRQATTRSPHCRAVVDLREVRRMLRTENNEARVTSSG